MKKKWIIWLLVIAVLCAAGIYMVSSRGGDLNMYAEYTAQTGNLSTWYSFEGEVKSNHTQTLIAPASTTVKEVYVAEGDSVVKDDRLLRLANGDTIKAGIAGEVSEMHVETDDPISSGDVLVDIVDFNRLEIEIKVDEYDVNAVRVGQTMDVTVNAIDTVVQSTVLKLSRQPLLSSGVSYYTATLSLPQLEGVLPGMEVEAKLLDKQANGVVLLKMDMLSFDSDNQPYVLLKQDGRAVRTAVSTGINDGTYVEITSGLQSGDIVLYRDTALSPIEIMEKSRK